MIQEIAVDVISSRVAAAVCTAPPIRDNSSRRTVIQEQATAESFLNITYTPFVDSLQVRIQQSMAASLVRQPKHAVRSVGNAVVRCREKRGSRLARIRCNIVLQNLPLSETACRASGFLSVPIACIAKENGIVFDKNLPSPTAEKMVHFCTVLPLL